MLLHFVVISLFTRQAPDVRLGPKDPDLAHEALASQMHRMGLKPHKPFDPMWYLTSNGEFVGYVKVFRTERYARNWFRDLSEQENSENIWAYWRDGRPVAMMEEPNAKGANQFVDSIALCRVRAFSDESAARNGVSRWFSGNLTADEIFLDEKKRKAERARRDTNVNRSKRSALVEPSDWEVRRDGGIDGPSPSAELSRTYRISGLAPPETSATFKIVCRLQSEGLEGGIESERNNLRLYRQLNFYLKPFRLPCEASFVMGLSTATQSTGGEFDVFASPVDDETSVFNKFGGRNDTKTCLDVMMSGDDIIFKISDSKESLVNFLLPNDGEFKRLVREACEQLGQTEIAYQVMRSQFSR
jgi:hypothetical protein